MGWQIELVDSADDVGRYASLALDDQGLPHISYCQYDPARYLCTALKYAHYDRVEWQIQTVDSAGDVGEYTSLALDPANQPHISYFDVSRLELRYARYNGGNWQIETIGAGMINPSLAIDSQGRPHISCRVMGPQEDLGYIHHDGTHWITETLGLGYYGAGNSLALDAADRPHIVFSQYYAHFDGAAWQIEAIPAPAIHNPSLALDAAGLPHIGLGYAGRVLTYIHGKKPGNPAACGGGEWPRKRSLRPNQACVGFFLGISTGYSGGKHAKKDLPL